MNKKALTEEDIGDNPYKAKLYEILKAAREQAVEEFEKAKAEKDLKKLEADSITQEINPVNEVKELVGENNIHHDEI